MDIKTLRRADLVTSVALMIVSFAGITMSVPLLLRTLARERFWYKSAGLFPMIVCLLLGICAVILFIRAKKDGASFDFFTREKIIGFFKLREFRVATAVIIFLAVYIFIMLPLMSYETATFIYLFVFMFAFMEKNFKNGIKTLLISAAATAALTYGFGHLAMIPLP